MIKSPTPLSIIMPIRSNTLLPQQRVSRESLFAFSFFNNSEKEKKHVSKKTPPTAAVEQQSMVENEVRSHSGQLKQIFAQPVYILQCTQHVVRKIMQKLSLSSYTQKLPNDFLKLSLNVPYQPLFQKENKQTNKKEKSPCSQMGQYGPISPHLCLITRVILPFYVHFVVAGSEFNLCNIILDELKASRTSLKLFSGRCFQGHHLHSRVTVL